jgi:hypothetical protein
MTYISANTIALSGHREASREHEIAASRDDYEILVKKKNGGGNCSACFNSTKVCDDLLCRFKRNKKVNPLAICQHFKE